jgi:hypothetical protein
MATCVKLLKLAGPQLEGCAPLMPALDISAEYFLKQATNSARLPAFPAHFSIIQSKKGGKFEIHAYSARKQAGRRAVEAELIGVSVINDGDQE